MIDIKNRYLISKSGKEVELTLDDIVQLLERLQFENSLTLYIRNVELKRAICPDFHIAENGGIDLFVELESDPWRE